ncbi:hypothetical protein [Pseudoalteromonas sp. 120-MNA-CIBAN-0494]|uniref:hypothetical protein n=1 Tax=unclassified Pseudoalteromonas TaxID=194690 RepID=UPI003317BF86
MIILDEHEIFSLVSLSIANLENLRLWKNKHRNSFFHKEIITTKQQLEWFNSYLNDSENQMYIVMLNGEAIGCMGYRFKEGVIDVYNIMRGVETNHEKFTMSDAFKLMLNFINYKYQKKISCVVLNENPAFNWYLKNEFEVKEEYETYSLLEYNPKKYSKNFIVKED